MSPVAVLIPSAGLSTRFGRNKLKELLLGESVMLRTVRAFIDRPDTAVVVLATPAGLTPRETLPQDLAAFAGGHPKLKLIEGGPTRAHSVQRALAAVPADVEWVAVHDAARPLISADLIDRLYAHAESHGSAVPAMPVKLTIKQAVGPLPASVGRTLPRAQLWEMQTPQVMRRADLTRAFDTTPTTLETVTDDAQLLESVGLPVWLIDGEERNLKLTTPQDLAAAEGWLR